jgi:hypothetical protein
VEQLRQAAHADAAGADEVDVFDAPVHAGIP